MIVIDVQRKDIHTITVTRILCVDPSLGGCTVMSASLRMRTKPSLFTPGRPHTAELSLPNISRRDFSFRGLWSSAPADSG